MAHQQTKLSIYQIMEQENLKLLKHSNANYLQYIQNPRVMPIQFQKLHIKIFVLYKMDMIIQNGIVTYNLKNIKMCILFYQSIKNYIFKNSAAF
jgi:hypothetical protein